MKHLGLLFGLFAMIVGQAALAAHWHSTAQRHAEHLQETIEVVDEEFHTYHVPNQVIQITHHVEEVSDALAADMFSLSLREAKTECNHIANDMNEIFPILKRQGFFSYSSLRNAWNHMAQAHGNLSHYLWYHHDAWGSEEMIEVSTF